MPKVKVPKHAIILGIAWTVILMIQFVFPIGGQNTTTPSVSQGSSAQLTRSADPQP